MKKIIAILLTVHCSLFTVLRSEAQSCLPEGISFQSQSQVDSFQINYPGCTRIEGNVLMNGAIDNLNGLNTLSSIGGDLIIDCVLFMNMTGLDSITSIGGNLGFFATQLSDMTGLGSLDSIGGNLTFGCHTNTGIMCNNPELANLSGLENLSFIGGMLTILESNALSDINALIGLTSVSKINIQSNPILTSISGLDNLAANSISSLTIAGNSSLSTCQSQSICDYLADPGGDINIYGNAVGCNNPIEVAGNCGITLSCLPFGNYWLKSQSDIDDFQTSYPGCSELGGCLYIIGSDITNLNGMETVTSIEGSLIIGYEGYGGGGNPLLESLDGLENITSIGGGLIMQHNGILENITGLRSLVSIGGFFDLLGNDGIIDFTGLENLVTINGGIQIRVNNSLKTLSGLNNVISAGGTITILMNDSLSSLTGLENIEAGSISDLSIYFNDALTECDVKSICNYLAAPNGTIEISSNAPGCNSQEEVEAACLVGFEDPTVQSSKFKVQSFPNPTSGTSHFTFHISQDQEVTLKIYDVNGREVAVVLDKKMAAGEHTVRWDLEGLPAGLYFIQKCEMRNGKCEMGKLVKY